MAMSRIAHRVETGKRLKKARLDAGHTAEGVAEKLAVSTQTVFNWESGRQFPEPTKLIALASLFGVSVDYLLGREEARQRSTAALLRDLSTMYERLNLSEIPLLGVVPAGEPMVPIELSDESIEVPSYLIRGIREAFALLVAGNSLSDMGIHDRQIVVVDPDTAVVDGKVYIVRIDGEVTAKRVFRQNGGLRLEGATGSIYVSDQAEVETLGRVVGAGSWIKL